MNIVIVSIGSNIDADFNIREMLALLGRKVKILQVSPLIRTRPVGITDQPDFTNGAVKIETDMEIDDLNHTLKSIEDQLGRDRSLPKFGPRTIDLDIVAWNRKIIDEDYYERDFLKASVDILMD